MNRCNTGCAIPVLRERSLIQERVNAGLLAAKHRGRIGGRPRRLDDEKIEAAKALLETGKTVSGAAQSVGVPRSTLVDSLRRTAFQAKRSEGTAQNFQAQAWAAAVAALLLFNLKENEEMKFLQWAIHAGSDNVVQVELDHAANVTIFGGPDSKRGLQIVPAGAGLRVSNNPEKPL